MKTPIKFAFFGGEPLGVPVLNKLKSASLMPSLIVCNPDRPSGRGHTLTPPPVKIWAEKHSIEVFQPTSYKEDSVREKLTEADWDLFVVVAYNFILPSWLIELPKHQTINLHPSMLPKLRGASPIRSAILNNTPEEIGVTVMLMDEEMDHGPILRQEKVTIDQANWPISGPELDTLLADKGGEILAETIPLWLDGNITPTPQTHEEATYCGRFQKGQNELRLNPQSLPNGDFAVETLCKIKAFADIGDTYFIHNNKRIKIKDATISTNGQLKILRVIPEGKKETDFENWLQNIC